MNCDGTEQQDATHRETTQAGFAALIGAPMFLYLIFKVRRLEQ